MVSSVIHNRRSFLGVLCLRCTTLLPWVSGCEFYGGLIILLLSCSHHRVCDSQNYLHARIPRPVRDDFMVILPNYFHWSRKSTKRSEYDVIIVDSSLTWHDSFGSLWPTLRDWMRKQQKMQESWFVMQLYEKEIFPSCVVLIREDLEFVKNATFLNLIGLTTAQFAMHVSSKWTITARGKFIQICSRIAFV